MSSSATGSVAESIVSTAILDLESETKACGSDTVRPTSPVTTIWATAAAVVVAVAMVVVVVAAIVADVVVMVAVAVVVVVVVALVVVVVVVLVVLVVLVVAVVVTPPHLSVAVSSSWVASQSDAAVTGLHRTGLPPGGQKKGESTGKSAANAAGPNCANGGM